MMHVALLRGLDAALEPNAACPADGLDVMSVLRCTVQPFSLGAASIHTDRRR